MMMSLGQFVFSLPTLAHQELQRKTNWRHGSTSRIGARPALQFMGLGEETITLPGVILPEFGQRTSLDQIHQMADTGAPFVLVDGMGRVYGQFVITEKSETASYFNQLGDPRRIEFSISLQRVDDNIVDAATTPDAP
ncbi:MAG: phage tail protein [Burkholderiales bacterium]|nr:phage tail protein [Burkholderiales bacterium]